MTRCRRVCYGLRCERELGHGGWHVAHVSRFKALPVKGKKVYGFEMLKWKLKVRKAGR